MRQQLVLTTQRICCTVDFFLKTILCNVTRVLVVFQSDLDQYKTALSDAGCDLSPLNYIKQWK